MDPQPISDNRLAICEQRQGCGTMWRYLSIAMVENRDAFQWRKYPVFKNNRSTTIVDERNRARKQVRLQS